MDEKVSFEDGINQIKAVMESVPSMKRCRVGMDFLRSVQDYLLQHPDQIERYINLLRNTLNKDFAAVLLRDEGRVLVEILSTL